MLASSEFLKELEEKEKLKGEKEAKSNYESSRGKKRGFKRLEKEKGYMQLMVKTVHQNVCKCIFVMFQ